VSAREVGRRAAVLALDLLILVSALAVLLILLTGGGVYTVAGARVSARTVDNPLFLLLALSAARYFLRTTPFLGVPSLDLRSVPAQAQTFVGWFHRVVSASNPKRLLIAVILFSAILKLSNAWFHYGFYSGDDVEVHEMTFSRLLDWEWRPWDLRSPVFPMAFVYPVQALAWHAGFQDEAILIFLGRAVVVGFSLLNLLLVFRIGKIVFGSPAAGACAALLLAVSKLHTCFASTVLPRTVAATFLLLAFLVLLKEHHRVARAVVAGALIAAGASLRFSEAVFVVPALAHLLVQARWRDAMFLGTAFGVTLAVILGAADLLYWGDAFHSLKHVVDYTLVQKQSSRGYQPFHHYATQVVSWSDPFFAILVVLSFRLRRWSALLWGIVPVVLLSFLPHKESRYLVAVLPFLALLAGGALAALLERATHTKRPGSAALLAFALIGLLLFEAGGWRFRRSEPAVDVARYLRAHSPVSGAALDSPWRAGGRLYTWRIPVFVEMDAENDSLDEILGIVSQPEIEYAAFRHDVLDRLGYRGELEKLGYRNVPLKTRPYGGTYDLLRRERTDR
jgi:hypothetical protein